MRQVPEHRSSSVPGHTSFSSLRRLPHGPAALPPSPLPPPPGNATPSTPPPTCSKPRSCATRASSAMLFCTAATTPGSAHRLGTSCGAAGGGGGLCPSGTQCTSRPAAPHKPLRPAAPTNGWAWLHPQTPGRGCTHKPPGRGCTHKPPRPGCTHKNPRGQRMQPPAGPRDQLAWGRPRSLAQGRRVSGSGTTTATSCARRESPYTNDCSTSGLRA
jgi:hypothetical protein